MTVERKTYAAPPLREREILRYAGIGKQDLQSEALMYDCLRELRERLTYRVCFTEEDIAFKNGRMCIGHLESTSKDLQKNLLGCERAVIFAATVGIEPDRLIARYHTISPARALFFQAIGSERVEALCDCFCRELSEREEKRGRAIRPRFSPGYGDLPLQMQRTVFEMLDCAKHIGISLNESLLMSPTKSVTAIVGIAPADRKKEERERRE